MCGLIGIVTEFTNGFETQDAKIFRELLYVDALRGEDSTGVGVFYNDGSIDVLKEATHAKDFLEEKEVSKVYYSLISKGKAALGHNRKKTSGTISDETAHPFVLDDLNKKARYVFMHNGTLTNFFLLKTKIKEILESIEVFSYTHPSTDVDSELLGTLITLCNGESIKIEKVLSFVEGAYACIWIDQVTETLYLLRNKERPLWIGFSKVGIVFGSEPDLIQSITSRNYTKIEKWEEVKENVLYSISLKEPKININKLPLEIKKEIPTKAVPAIGGTSYISKHLASFQEAASKNASKRFQKSFLGTRQTFWVSEVSKMVDNYLIIGESFSLDNTKHIIRGLMNFNSSVHAKDFEGELAWGTITAVDYDKELQQLIISVKDIVKNAYQNQTACY